jgi:divalent metal cation (Fe/Co/Zn/Cd) transporter
MTVEGGVGIAAGVSARSIALIGWALSSVVEGLASVIVIWRFTGTRTHSATSERSAQKLVAVSFFLLAPYVAAESIRDLAGRSHVRPNAVAIALLASSVVLMPLLAVAKKRLAVRLDSSATAGEGTQNLLCAYLAGAVLVGLGAEAVFGISWLDPIAGLAVAAVAIKEGRDAWRGDACCATPIGFGAATDSCDCCDD